jgi:hypothetical protein
MTIDYTQPPQPGQPAPRGWWSRNWKWVVPVGCLTPILLVGGCVASIAWFVMSSIKGTDLYTDAVQRAQNDPRVIEALGEPVETGWWVTGNVNIDSNSGTADFAAPLMGTRKHGTLYVKGTREGGEWTYSVMNVAVDDGPIIDLMSPSPEEPDRTDPAAG